MKLFVAKLNRDVQDDHLVELFSQYGEVAYARVITDRDTGQSKCFGFVQMKENSDGQAALEALNGHELMGFRMVVKEAEERPREGGNRQSRDAGGRRPSNERPASSNSGQFRNQDSGEFSRHGGAQSEESKLSRKKAAPKRHKGKSGRDIYADGPKPARLKKTKPKNSDWMDDLEDY